jgi:glycosyltransferase involved in cell wall biosynthesis
VNVLLANPWPLDTLGGVSAVVCTLAEQLERRGDRVAHLVPRHGGSLSVGKTGQSTTYTASLREWNLRGLPWRSRIVFALTFPLSCWQLLRVLRRERIQIVNAHYFHGAWKHFFFLRRLGLFRLIVSLHGSDVLGPGGEASVRYLEENAHLVDALVFCSDGFRREVLSAESPLLPRSRVILNGLDVAPAVRSESGRGRDYVVCVAHLREHKGQDVLLRAFQQLAGQFPALELDLIGEGPFRVALEKLAAELGIGDRVNLRGLVPSEQVREEVAGARAFCLPSRREPFGMVLVEAMSLGIPIVATTAGGIPEVVRHGVDGVLVEPDDPERLGQALRQVLTDTPLRERLTRSARERARAHFSAARFGEQYRALFAEALGRAT